MESALRFKYLCSDAGLTVDQAAKLLHVTPRTVYAWFSGASEVPYAAYKLVRVLRYFELPGDAWRGWHFAAGKLWTPEGFGFNPQDASWWSLLVRKAAGWSELYRRLYSPSAPASGTRSATAGAELPAGVMMGVSNAMLRGTPDGNHGENVKPSTMRNAKGGPHA